jgi:hypothetical protein
MDHKAVYVLTLGILGVLLSFPVVSEAQQNTFDPLGTVTKEMKDFKSCPEAVNWMNAGAELGLARPQFDNHSSPLVTFVKIQDGWTASSKIWWTYNSTTSSTKLIVPQWPNMTTADNNAVQTLEAALLAHEQGHHKLAKDFMATAAKTLTAKGSTRDEAFQNLSTKADDYTNKIQTSVEDKQRDYDDKTAHGVNQAAVGGKNVELVCP